MLACWLLVPRTTEQQAGDLQKYAASHCWTMSGTSKVFTCMQVYLGGIEAQALDGLQKGLDGVIAGSKHACPLLLANTLL